MLMHVKCIECGRMLVEVTKDIISEEDAAMYIENTQCNDEDGNEILDENGNPTCTIICVLVDENGIETPFQ